MSKIAIIGSGFSSLAASCYLAKYGYEVVIYEKNSHVGGRARQLKRDGFTFDMGPTWYWMPDVFERFFADFKKRPSDYYQLDKLNPAYSVYFNESDKITIGDNLNDIYSTFEKEERGSAEKLSKFIQKAGNNYNIAIKDLVYNPGVSPLELVSTKTLVNFSQFFNNISSDIRKSFSNKRLISILEFPVLFLGAKPSDTPSFYSFMNYADFGLGTWHPKKGMYSVISGMIRLAESLGVTIHTDANVEEIIIENNQASGLIVNNTKYDYNFILSGADYHHTEQLLPIENRQYTEQYWKKKTFAPSALLFYVGFKEQIANVDHHTLFFDTDFELHAENIYDLPEWPENPLFYASFPSKTDESVAPEGKEAGIFLVPLAPGLQEDDSIRETYFEMIIQRLEKLTNQTIREKILFKESFGISDFIKDYNSYKGNAYGLANTLFQTAFLRPKLKSKKVKGLYFTGQLTVPGPGVPPALISGKLVAELIHKYEAI